MTDAPLLRTEPRESGDGRTVVAVWGELDIATTGALAGEVRQQLVLRPVVLDLRELSFADSAGVKLLVDLHQEAVAAGQGFTIDREMHPNVRQVLELTGLLGLLPIESREDGS